MNDTERRRELADFLRTRRARISPLRAGLGEKPRRRTPGLRREEVADLADIGIAWYTWLEQGRDIRASAEVLARVAGVLELSADETLALFLLARRTPPLALPPETDAAPPALLRFLDAQSLCPSYLTNRRWDLLAWNPEAAVLFEGLDHCPAAERNVVWLMLTHPWPRHVIVDWETVARRVLALFRLDCSRCPDDVRLTELIGRLTRSSPEFRQWWPCHEVLGSASPRKDLNHPTLGRLALEPLVFSPQEAPALRLTVYSLLPDYDTPAKLKQEFRRPAANCPVWQPQH